MYKPLEIKSGAKPSYINQMTPTKGINREDLQQTINPKYCINLVNYIPYSYGLESREGPTKVAERAGSNPPTLFKLFQNNIWLVGHGTKIEAYDEVNDTWTTIKDDFAVGSVFDGSRAADYFLTTNGIERPGRISRTIDYDAQTGNFTTGQLLTGATSGATALILEDSDGGTTGTLTLGNISGTFQDNETITDSATGSATVNGTIGFTYTTIAGAPICEGIVVIGPRAYALRLQTQEAGIHYSGVDTGANPPFNTWTILTTANAGGDINFRNAGAVRSVVPLGEFIVAFSDNGSFAFKIDQIDSGGTIVKIDVIQEYTEDFGGARGAVTTPYGVYYVNEAGLWQMVSVGVTNVPNSRQQRLTSTSLGSKPFQETDQSSTDLFYSEEYRSIFIVGAKNSAFNNFFLGYKIDLGAFYEFKNLNINRFAKKGGEIYVASSVKPTIYKLFDGYDDDGLNIGTEMYQEIALSTLFHAHSLSEFYAGGELSKSSELNISFDIFTIEGKFIKNKSSMTWTANNQAGGHDEWTSAAFGSSAFGGASGTAGLRVSFGGGSPRINNFQRLRVKITSGSKVRHILNWISVKTTQKQPIKRRNISLN